MSDNHYDLSEVEYSCSLDELLYEKEAPSLDDYKTTGVYVECVEEEEHPNHVLIVLGTPIIRDSIYQLYISDDNHAYARSYTKHGWRSWFKIGPNRIANGHYDMNQLLHPDFLLIDTTISLEHAPSDFWQVTPFDTILLCTGPEPQWPIQLLIDGLHQTFWLRYYNTKRWSNWQTFV